MIGLDEPEEAFAAVTAGGAVMTSRCAVTADVTELQAEALQTLWVTVITLNISSYKHAGKQGQQQRQWAYYASRLILRLVLLT